MNCPHCKQQVPISQITVIYSDENRTAIQAQCYCTPEDKTALPIPTFYAVVSQDNWTEEPADEVDNIGTKEETEVTC